MINKDTTYLYYSNISKYTKASYKKYYDMLPPSRKLRIDMLRFEADKARGVFSYGLLYEALKLFDVDITEYSFMQNKNMKPYLDKCPVKFSISHSGNYVAVSFSLEDVGCDIQEISNQKYDAILPLLMNEEELKKHLQLDDDNKKHNFYNIWSKKESYIKLLGVGLSMSMKSFNANSPSNDTHIYTSLLKFKYYISCSFKTKNLCIPAEISL